MTRTRIVRAVAAGLAMSALVAPSGLAIGQVVRSSIDLGAGVGYGTNPFLVVGDDTDSGFVEASVRPTLRIEEERSVTSIDAYVRHQQYFERFDDATSFGAAARNDTRVNERLAIYAGVGIDSSILGGANFTSPVFLPPSLPGDTGTSPDLPGLPGLPGTPTVPGVPGVPGSNDPIGGPIVVDPSLGDIGLLGTRSRRTSYTGNLGLSYSPGPRDTFGLGVSASRSDYGDEVFGANYSQYVGNASYQRQISEGLSVGGQLIASYVNYESAPDARTLQPQLTVTARLSSTWTLSGGIGASFTHFEGEFGLPERDTTALSGNFSLCNTQVRSNFCLSGSRGASPSGFGGVQTVTSVGASYSYQLGERDGINASVAYSRSADSQFDIQGQELVSGSVGWSRQLSQRLRLNATAGYRDVFFGDADREADFSGLIGIGYILGDR